MKCSAFQRPDPAVCERNLSDIALLVSYRVIAKKGKSPLKTSRPVPTSTNRLIIMTRQARLVLGVAILLAVLSSAVADLVADAPATDGDESPADDVSDEPAYYESLKQPSRLLNHIVYVPESHFQNVARDGDTVIRGPAVAAGDSAADENGHLYKRDAQLSDLDEPTEARRVVRAVAGCSAATTIDVQPRVLEPNTGFSVNFANLEATGMDFGSGPEYWASWNASVLEINGAATTTLTEVQGQTITTKGAFDGCFETTKVGWEMSSLNSAFPVADQCCSVKQVTSVLTATNTQPGAAATLTPNLANRYFVDITAAPGPYSTRIPFKVTTTTYTFPTTSATATNLGGLFQTIGAPRLRPRPCPSIPKMVNSGVYPATFTNVKRGATLTATISHVTESVIDASSTRGTTWITWQAVYSAGELNTVSYTLTTSAGKTFTNTKRPFTKTVSKGRLVTRRRVATTPLNDAKDGCLDRIIDRANWVVPDNVDDGVYNAVGAVNDVEFHGLVLMEHAHTKFAAPYPSKSVPPKPTTITPTQWMCSSFYAAVHPSTATAGETVTVQLYNLPATPIKLLNKGWSTVYEATYAATLLSNAVPVTAVPSTTTRTTVGTPTCISATFKMIVTSSKKAAQMTAAPSPTPVYEVQGTAKNFSDKPDVPNPPRWAEVEASTDIYLKASPEGSSGGNLPVIPNYPALVGPVTVKTRITYDKNAPGANLYSISKNVVTGDSGARKAILFGRDEGSAGGEEGVDDDLIFGSDGEVEVDREGDVDSLDSDSQPRLNARSGQTTVTSLRIKLGAFNKVAFVARDKSESDLYVDLYERDFRNISSASDWSVEWLQALPLSGSRTLAPFTVTSTYFIPRSKWSGSSRTGVQPNTYTDLNLVLRSKTTITPWWKATGPNGTPTIRFNVSAPMIWNPVNYTFTPAHPFAKKSAFTSYVFSALKTGRVSAADYSTRAAGKAIWAVETDKRGSFKVPKLPVIYTRNFGPVEELKARYASDSGSSGRLGAPNPSAPGGPTEAELEKDLKERFKDLDPK